jgi:two-component system, LytTR family, sensor kinase
MNRLLRYRADHFLFWILTVFFHAYTRTYLIEKAGLWQFLLELVVRNGLLAALLYVNVLIILPKTNQTKNWLAYTALFLLSVTLYVFAKNAHDVYLYAYVIGDESQRGFFHNTLYNLSIALFYVAFSSALYLSRQWYVQRETLRQLTVDKLNTELEYLKAQLNPHFLFNSINTIFFQIDKHNTEARETLAKFSDMLRYQLYECNGNTIAIEKEIQYLKNYVELQRLRKDENYHVEFLVADSVAHFSVPPLLLMPFIENAFKHVSNFTDRKNEIKITLSKMHQSLHLTVINTIDLHTAQETGGIGLKNVQRRLELLYPNRYALKIKKEENSYQVTLTLEL